MGPLWDDPDPHFNASQDSNDEVFDINKHHLDSQIPILSPPILKMAVSPDEAETSYSLRTGCLAFHRFGHLSTELRKMIWLHAIAKDPRIFEMYHPDLHIYDQSGKQISRRKVIKPRAVAAACAESRNLFSEVFLGPGTYLINFEVDTIYFGPHSFWYYQVVWRPPPRDPAQYALYYGSDLDMQRWQRRQKWNHWRPRESIPKGEEEDDDPYQNRDQTRYEKDPYHPLLSSESYALERLQIKNVAFDLEFWNETAERSFGGQRHLMLMFPSIDNFILAAGDIGESMEVRRTDHGVNTPREEVYKRRLKNYMTAQMAVTYTGQVKFHPEAAPTDLQPEIIEITGDSPYLYPAPVTMCISRGGHFKGHVSRFSGERLPRELAHWKCRPSDCACDNCMYVDRVDAEEEDDDNEDDLLGRGRTPRQREVEYLHDKDATVSELEDLEELRVELNPTGKTAEEILDAVRDFHASADAGRDDDTDEEGSEDDDEIIIITIADSAAEDVQNNVASSKDSRENAKDKKRAEKDQKIADKAAQKAAHKANALASKQTPLTVVKHEKHAAGPLANETVASITSSKFHYGHLKYTVTWTTHDPNTIRSDRTRYMPSEPWMQTASAQALIRAWHAAHPAEDSPSTQKPMRKAYGTVTRDGKRIEQLDVAESSTSGLRASTGGEAVEEEINGEVEREESPLSSLPPSPSPSPLRDAVDNEIEMDADDGDSDGGAPGSSASLSSQEPNNAHSPEIETD